MHLDLIFKCVNEAGRELAAANRSYRPNKKTFWRVKRLLKGCLPSASITERFVHKVGRRLYGKPVDGFRDFLRISAQAEGVIIGARIGAGAVTLDTATEEEGLLAKLDTYTAPENPNDRAPQRQNADRFIDQCWPDVLVYLEYLGRQRFNLLDDGIVFSEYQDKARDKIADGLPEFYGDDDCQIMSWIYIVAEHVFFNILRRRNRLQPQDDLRQLMSANADIRQIESRQLLESLMNLPAITDIDRKIAKMWSEGYSHAEIAPHVSLSPDNVKIHHFRMMQRLRKAAVKPNKGVEGRANSGI